MADRRTRQKPAADPSPTLYRTGAVARMLRMPAATLRIWERRHGALSGAARHRAVAMHLIPRLTCHKDWSVAEYADLASQAI
jgi:hypothetical protein